MDEDFCLDLIMLENLEAKLSWLLLDVEDLGTTVVYAKLVSLEVILAPPVATFLTPLLSYKMEGKRKEFCDDPRRCIASVA